MSMSQLTIENSAAAAELPALVDELDALIDREIRKFVSGDSDGYELLDGIYGDIIDEPVPARLRALLTA